MTRDLGVGGGLTGETGDLTPDDPNAEFVPAERREVSGDHAQGAVTRERAQSAPAQRGVVGEPEEHPTGGPTNLATRDTGYGSEHGLAPDDPAYRMEARPPAPGTEGDPGEEPVAGGDDVQEDEPRF